MDTFYISHGSPTLSIDDTLPAGQFLRSWNQTRFPTKPSSILVVSGHWETSVPTVNSVSGSLDTIYDFYGFPKSMYKLKYPAPGCPALASRVKHLLTSSGLFPRVDVDTKRGLDHGAWVPLMFMYPKADIPVCQLSVQTKQDGNYHFNLGKVLAPLREEGVLIVGSGSAVHNLRALKMEAGATVAPWAMEFDTWLKEALVEGRYEDVNRWEEKAPHAKMAHPWPDHIYPLHVAMGAAGAESKAKLIHESWQADGTNDESATNNESSPQEANTLPVIDAVSMPAANPNQRPMGKKAAKRKIIEEGQSSDMTQELRRYNTIMEAEAERKKEKDKHMLRVFEESAQREQEKDDLEYLKIDTTFMPQEQREFFEHKKTEIYNRMRFQGSNSTSSVNPSVSSDFDTTDTSSDYHVDPY